MNNVAHQLSDAFDASRKDELVQLSNNLVVENDRQYEIQKPIWIFSIYWLIYRNLLIVARDPSIQKLRIVQKIVMNTFKNCLKQEQWFTNFHIFCRQLHWWLDFVFMAVLFKINMAFNPFKELSLFWYRKTLSLQCIQRSHCFQNEIHCLCVNVKQAFTILFSIIWRVSWHWWDQIRLFENWWCTFYWKQISIYFDSGSWLDNWTISVHNHLLLVGWIKSNCLCICHDFNHYDFRNEYCNGLW